MKKKKIKNILNQTVRPQIKDLGYDPNDFFVCGGCIVSMLNDEPVNDFDVYCKKDNINEDMVANLWANSEDNDVVSNTGNAITLKSKIQFITKFGGKPREVVENFDFLHTKTFYDFQSDELYLPSEVKEVIKRKILVYTGSAYPVSSLLRIPKYIKRGWVIGAVDHMKIVMDTNALDLINDSNVLKDQLMGVDLGDFFNDQGEIDTNLATGLSRFKYVEPNNTIPPDEPVHWEENMK